MLAGVTPSSWAATPMLGGRMFESFSWISFDNPGGDSGGSDSDGGSGDSGGDGSDGGDSGDNSDGGGDDGGSGGDGDGDGSGGDGDGVYPITVKIVGKGSLYDPENKKVRS